MGEKPGLIRDESGQSLVEFAISLVLLLLLVAVIMDAARALFTYLSMRDAAQEGALFASAYPPYDPDNPSVPDASLEDDIRERVCDSSNIMSALCDNSSVNISISPTVSGVYCLGSSGSEANGIKVRIDYPSFPLTMPLVGAIIGSQTVAISAEVIDTILAPKCP